MVETASKLIHNWRCYPSSNCYEIDKNVWFGTVAYPGFYNGGVEPSPSLLALALPFPPLPSPSPPFPSFPSP